MVSLLLLLAAAFAAPLELRGLVGAQIDPESHGELDFGARAGDWSAELYTDTLQLAWNPTFPGGRAWLDLRAEGAVAGLMLSPWTDGAPDPTRARIVSYAGPEAGAMTYGPGGTGFGLSGRVLVYSFAPREQTTAPVPGPTLIESLDGLFGWWHGDFSMTARFGVDYAAGLDAPLSPVVGEAVAPRAAAELRWRPGWFVAPRLEVRAGTASGQGEVTRTRLGGDMPYQVPLAGAGWSEFWVEDYAAARLGISVGSAEAAPASGVGAELATPPSDARVRGRVLVLTDVATFDGSTAWGLGLRGEVRRKRLWGQAEVGWAGGVPRKVGVSPVAAMVRLGVDWTAVKGR